MMRAALLLAGIFFYATPASAALSLCNRTSYILYAATASLRKQKVHTQGWTRIVPGSCQIPIQNDLMASQYFVYARSSMAHAGPARAWGGSTALCVKDNNFSLHVPVGAPDCPGDDSFTRPFAALDTHHMRSWTLNFDDTPPERNMATARQDGLERLLRDNHVADGDKRAVVTLRKRLHLETHASTGQLFDALETAALQNAAPAGFTVCNDGTALALIALGFKTATNWSTHGWWRIAPGDCAKTLSSLPVKDRVYLLAQTKAGRDIVGGATKFCITDIAFDIKGREHCTTRGFKSAGFMAIPTGIHSHLVHIGSKGLLPWPGRISK